MSSATLSFFDVPETAAEAVKISGQRAQVEALMSDGQFRTLPGLVKELKQRFGAMYSETSVSARLRDLRRKGFDVERTRTRPGSNLYAYRAVKRESAVTA